MCTVCENVENVVEPVEHIRERFRVALGGLQWESGSLARPGTYKSKPISFQQFMTNYAREFVREFGIDLETGIVRLHDGLREFYGVADLVPFRFVTGDDIHEYWDEDRQGGTYRAGSCMGYSSRAHLRELYARNPDRVGLLVWDKGYLTSAAGSSLLWLQDGIGYLDKPYCQGWYPGVRSVFPQIVARWVADNLGLSELRQVYGGNSVQFSTRLRWHGDDMPYMDSVSYCSAVEPGDKWIKVSTNCTWDCDIPCSDADGTDPTGSGCKCKECGSRVSPDESYSDDWGNQYCDDCFHELFISWGDEYYRIEDCTETTVYVGDTRGNRSYTWRYVYTDSDDVYRGYVPDDVLGDDCTELDSGDDIAQYCLDSCVVELGDGSKVSPWYIENMDIVYPVDDEDTPYRSGDCYLWESDSEYHTEPEPPEPDTLETDESGNPVPVIWGGSEWISCAEFHANRDYPVLVGDNIVWKNSSGNWEIIHTNSACSFGLHFGNRETAIRCARIVRKLFRKVAKREYGSRYRATIRKALEFYNNSTVSTEFSHICNATIPGTSSLGSVFRGTDSERITIIRVLRAFRCRS